DETGGRYVHVIADGDVATSGQLAKAIACGADAAMLGVPLALAAELNSVTPTTDPVRDLAALGAAYLSNALANPDHVVLRLAAAPELPCEHPLAAAIVRAARGRDLRLPEVTEFTAHPGRGVTALVGDRLIGVGSPATAGPGLASGQATVDAVQAHGYTAVIVTCEHQPIGVLALTDQLRPEAAAAVRAATELTGVEPALLTGDNRATADRLAARVGITDVRADLLPDDKVTAVRQWQADGRTVTVVGDGINDAPALAAAEVGIAMGGAGSDLTLQTADAVVVRDDLTTIPAVIALSRQARRVVTANLAIAATFIGVLVVWDLAGNLPLPLGVAGHEGSTVIVGLNGLRLLRRAAWERAAGIRD
ncbi:HAD-IC family P-type ATPase, partial [Nocardia abscessus]|uniref:HAD-IC family P-type ATPase n=1 Tax=Nocardia abscessus TaxID=120957 RepID=UPI002456D353